MSLHPRDRAAYVAPPPPLTPAGPVDPVVTAYVAEAGAHGVSLNVRTARGRTGTLRLCPATGSAARITLRMSDVLTSPRISVVNESVHGCTVERSPGTVTLRLEALRVEIRLSPFTMSLTDRHGRTVRQATDVRDPDDHLTVLPFGVTELADGRLAHHDSWIAEPDEHFYGLGERFTGLDLRGQRVQCWVQDALGSTGTRSYKAVPFLLSSRGYAVLVDTTTPASFDLAHHNTGAWTVIVPDEELDYYLITGTPGECLAAYRDLTGPALLPPKWAFGPWISGGFRRDSAEEVRDRARRIREHRFPCDVLHIDTYWQPHGSWSDMRWDTEAFPDPRGLVEDLAAEGLHVSLWMNPYIGVDSPYFTEVKRNGWFLRTRTGTDTDSASGDTWVGRLWGDAHPETALLDLTHPGAVDWFRGRIREALASGASVLKTDFGEAVPADAVAHNGMTGDRLHNLYPLLYNDLVAEVTREVTASHGLTWGRSTWTGGQRHGAKWTGDPRASWQDLASTLRAGLSLSLSGHPFWSHDIGGFHGTPDAELFVRWAQFGLLSPLSRFHGTTSRLPWDFGEEAYAAVLHAARLRMSLLPYLYAAAVEAVRTGEPLARPMPLDHPDRPDSHAADLQYLLGPGLLVAPLYAPGGRRQVWFPPGEWLPYQGGAPVTGPCWHSVDLLLPTAPLWLRAGSLLLTTAPADRAGSAPFGEVTAVWVRPRATPSRTARSVLYDEDGTRTVITAHRPHDDHLTLRTEGRGLRLHVAAPGRRHALATAEVDGVPTDVDAWPGADW
ncbi:alpha-xylosidase [Streptomyces sp. TRM68367]|uniref:glycoside hydrolase family 31 protein n=1 Tax=Streptomyces sp. TRM68367 TaxID=2758415 RepID=UPI00165A4DD4|nr:alpha-xylosidase [Streptomyces sp. TRM68367]MBC9726882.1 alpha-xylosidase [Streptomyces sp. TRM68367]